MTETTVKRHTWNHINKTSKQCAECSLLAVAARPPTGTRWLITYTTADGRSYTADKVPTCATEPAEPSSTPDERRQHASELDLAAGHAWREGDLDRAARLLADCAALDPDRELLWRQRREQLVRSVAKHDQTLADQQRQRLFAAGIGPDDPAMVRLREWNRAVFARELEAGQ
jgi:hypothetical protein